MFVPLVCRLGVCVWPCPGPLSPRASDSVFAAPIRAATSEHVGGATSTIDHDSVATNTEAMTGDTGPLIEDFDAYLTPSFSDAALNMPEALLRGPGACRRSGLVRT